MKLQFRFVTLREITILLLVMSALKQKAMLCTRLVAVSQLVVLVARNKVVVNHVKN